MNIASLLSQAVSLVELLMTGSEAFVQTLRGNSNLRPRERGASALPLRYSADKYKPVRLHLRVGGSFTTQLILCEQSITTCYEDCSVHTLISPLGYPISVIARHLAD